MFGGKKPSPEPVWCIAKIALEEEGIAGIARFIDRPPADQRRLKTALEIAWTYADEGLPSEQENNEMNAFERVIDPLIEDRGNSQLAYVRTGFGRKEWLFYVRDRDAFMQAFNDRLAGRPVYPIHIRESSDAIWNLWREFIEPIRKRATWEDPAN